MSQNVTDPLYGDEPIEVPLANAPLARVVAQIRFPEILSMQDKAFVAPFQERIRRTYPLAQSDVINTFVIGPQRMVSSTVWRYYDPQKNWRVSMSDTFLSLETTKYVSRKDFVERFGFILTQLEETINPSHIARVGVRYVDQVSLEGGESMKGMLRPEMAGIKDVVGNTKHVISEFEADTREGAVQVRWGHLPKDGTHDPDIMPAIQHPSWFLDVDSYIFRESEMMEYSAETVKSQVLALAGRAYSIFMWSVTDDFLVKYGKEQQ
ncbi:MULTISPECIES: TIGR04255 family protein [unclassified Rhizobium]|uniref:TIGR04255 family protein n=1 Tax=unclassified Rhizobium TaxID=2613769 RepID=UPI001044342C|nr:MULTISPECIES: TIGR04255 family protein [unclassified Rhizobium]MBB3397836.1 uncharacterized protein (TIGR04255 family) [Rhizobium sp. BK060]MBB4170837.1 uncharacterized protein (TIGR04255 family) [Rhizobium sp. BK538]TCM67872.1 uncharacterized protein (TIGR04255 family) [Rhizobium sp. BK068]